MTGSDGACLSFQATQGSTNRRVVLRASPVIKQDPVLKITNTKQASVVAQSVGEPT
jgi:hypothetical protein